MKINIHSHKQHLNSLVITNVCICNKKTIPNGLFSAGIHPWNFDNINLDNSFSILVDMIQNDKMVAVGEIGIDKKCGADLIKQIDVFVKQLKLAEQFDLPVIIHCVGGYEILQKYRKIYSQTPWIIHDFNSSFQMAEFFIKNGCFISFGNNFMRENSKQHEIVKMINSSNIFFETDVHKFKIKDIYNRAADILKINISNLEQQIELNFIKIFGNGYF